MKEFNKLIYLRIYMQKFSPQNIFRANQEQSRILYERDVRSSEVDVVITLATLVM